MSTESLSRPPASTQVDIDELAAAIDRRNLRARGLGSGNQFNGSTKFVNTMLTLLGALMLAGIVGGVSMYAHVSALAEKVDATNAKVDLIIAGRIR